MCVCGYGLVCFPPCTCSNADCVRLCVILPCLGIGGALRQKLCLLTSLLQSATLSLCPHTNTQPPPPTGPRQPPRLNVPKQQVLARRSTPLPPPSLLHLSLSHPILPPPASSLCFSGSSRLKTMSIVRGMLGRRGGLLVFVCSTLHIQIQPAAQLCRLQTLRLKKTSED